MMLRMMDLVAQVVVMHERLDLVKSILSISVVCSGFLAEFC